ncbi:MAG: CHASE2 domain-containing protein [Pseudoflavonifractor sp.]|nr:CHASE2 domain-containing protein [Pseudoflavonifractor sp.]
MKGHKVNIANILGPIIISLLLSSVLSQDISVATIMNLLNISGDSRIDDFYSRVTDLDRVKDRAESVVIVDVGDGGRGEIAEALTLISQSGAAATGVDFSFPYPSDPYTDSTLYAAIRQCPGVVMAQELVTENDSTDRCVPVSSSFFSDDPQIRFAATRLVSRTATTTVRECVDSFPLADGGAMQSFAAALVAQGRPERYAAARGNAYVPRNINFPRRSFNVISHDSLASNLAMLDGMIVIVGDMSGHGDMHRTTIADETPGVLIHASAVATMLEGSFPRPVPLWTTWIIGILMCTAILWTRERLSAHPFVGLTVRLVQLVSLCAIVYIGCVIFAEWRLILDVKKPLIMTLLGLLSLDLWSGFYKSYPILKEKATSLIKHTVKI